MNKMYSDNSKKEKVDTRDNWVTFMFKCRCAYFCFQTIVATKNIVTLMSAIITMTIIESMLMAEL